MAYRLQQILCVDSFGKSMYKYIFFFITYRSVKFMKWEWWWISMAIIEDMHL